MFGVSGVDLVVAACRNGVIGALPTVNGRSTELLDQWLGEIEARLFAAPQEPVCPNLPARRSRPAPVVQVEQEQHHAGG